MYRKGDSQRLRVEVMGGVQKWNLCWTSLEVTIVLIWCSWESVFRESVQVKRLSWKVCRCKVKSCVCISFHFQRTYSLVRLFWEKRSCSSVRSVKICLIFTQPQITCSTEAYSFILVALQKLYHESPELISWRSSHGDGLPFKNGEYHWNHELSSSPW